jgi:hypothetical protein
MAFHSNENKAMLWNLLSEQGLFNGIEGSRVPEVRRTFENNITQISQNSGDLMTLNKEFVQKMLKVLPMFKGMGPPQSGKMSGAIQEVYTAEKFQNDRIDKFNSKLSNVKSEFDSMIKLKKPNEIDFSDRKQNDYNSNIDQDLAAAIAARQLDMEQMVSSQQTSKKEAEAWINSENKSPTPNSNTNVSIEIKEKPKKHVTFEENVKSSDNSLDDLFGNLKQQTASIQNNSKDSEIISLLKEIIVNQKTLIDKMNSQNEASKKN